MDGLGPYTMEGLGPNTTIEPTFLPARSDFNIHFIACPEPRI